MKKQINLDDYVDVQGGLVNIIGNGLGYQGEGEGLNYFLRDIEHNLHLRKPEQLIVVMMKERKYFYQSAIYIPITDFNKKVDWYLPMRR